MITSKVPANWRDLQEGVARILRECGFVVEIEKKIRTVRNTVEIDVYGEEVIDGRKLITLFECKLWEASVPQEVVHSFRTVMADFGANGGYIISKNGFQKGALEAINNTSVKLKTWQEFQEEFEKTWFEKFMIHEVVRALDPLLTYTEPLLPKWFDQLPERDRKEYYALKEQYDDLGVLLMTLFTPYSRMLQSLEIPKLPLSIRIPPGRTRIPTEILEASAFRDLLEAAIAHGTEAIDKFRAIKTRNGF
jgi:restriction system protein